MTKEEQLEGIVLGACLVENPKALEFILARISPEHFSLELNRRVFEVITALS